MTRLIDADKLREKWIWGSTDRTKKVECIELVDLDNAPTVDAVEVVRCCDCKWYRKPYGGKEVLCTFWLDWLPTEEDDYCSFGERKEE